MQLIYGTTNQSKLTLMRARTDTLGIELLSLEDVHAPKLKIIEDGNSPLDNARIKALAYYQVLKKPLFSCDSGLYIDELDDARQPGINVRGKDDVMNDDMAMSYYASIAQEYGGRVTARYKNAIVLVMQDGEVYEYMGDDIASDPFYIVSTLHHKRHPGFPIDSISVHIKSGQYYFDRDLNTKYDFIPDGFVNFFKRTLKI